MRFFIVGLLLVHGLLHLLGLSGSPGKLIGPLWLLACVALLAAAIVLIADRQEWWLIAAGGVLLSQLLIINAWSAAKAGTVANVILVLPIVVAAAQARFQRESDAAALRLMAAAAPGSSVVTRAELEPLPPPVRRWLEGSGIVGRERARLVRLEQRGWMRTAAGQPWMPASAQQSFTVEPPGFVWNVRVTMKKVLPVVGRDSYLAGRGRMLIKAAGLVAFVDATGAKIDQGTMLRYLAEMMWFPSAALASYVRWEAVDANSAKATMSYGGVTASATFTFDERGRMTGLTAMRYRGNGEDATLDRWAGEVTRWGERDGLTMPVEGTVSWKLADGDLPYYRWEITDLAINPRSTARAPVEGRLQVEDAVLEGAAQLEAAAVKDGEHRRVGGQHVGLEAGQTARPADLRHPL
jgi:hypothetical protein